MKTELEVMLRDPKTTKKEMRDILVSNLEEVNKFTRLSNTLLQLSRLDHQGLTFAQVSFDDVVLEAIEQHRKRGRSILFTPHSKPLFVYGHQGSLEELLSILIDNAIKYSPKGSSIIIKLTKRSKRAHLAIINKGEGIHASQLPHIFDRFYRGDSSRTGGPKSGYGLGLSLAKKIIELHHGDITVASTPGKKTTFAVILPLFSKHKTQDS
jgi:signal transduction histidine kinase